MTLRVKKDAVEQQIIYNVICVSDDFYYRDVIKNIINRKEEFLAIPIIQIHPSGRIFHVYELYTLNGSYLGIFGESSFKITEKKGNNALYTSLLRNKKVFQILEE